MDSVKAIWPQTYEQKTAVFALAGGLFTSLLYVGGVWLLPGHAARFIALVLPIFCIGLLFIRHIRFAITLIVIYAPVEIFVQKWLPPGLDLASRYVTEALLVGLFLAVVAERLLSGKPWRRTPLDLPLCLFVAIGIVSAVVNQLPLVVLLMGLRITLRYLLLYYLVVLVGFNRQQVKKLLMAVLVMAAFVMTIGLLQAVIGPPMNRFLQIPDIMFGDTATRAISGFAAGHGRYIFSTLGRYDALGIYAVYILLITLAYVLHHRRRHIAWNWLIVATLICLALTLSRQSWLALYVTLWVWAIIGKKKWAIYVLFVLFIIPTAILLIALSFPDLVRYYGSAGAEQVTVITRILDAFSAGYLRVSSGSGGRLFVLRHVSERILEMSPWLGFGPGRFGTITAQYFGYSDADLLGMAPGDVYLVFDVNWVTLLGQYGSLGLLAFLFVFWRAWRRTRWLYHHAVDSLSRSVALATAGIIPAFMVLAFFGPNFEQRIVSMYAWLLIALVVTLSQRTETYEHSHRQ